MHNICEAAELFLVQKVLWPSIHQSPGSNPVDSRKILCQLPSTILFLFRWNYDPCYSTSLVQGFVDGRTFYANVSSKYLPGYCSVSPRWPRNRETDTRRLRGETVSKSPKRSLARHRTAGLQMIRAIWTEGSKIFWLLLLLLLVTNMQALGDL